MTSPPHDAIKNPKVAKLVELARVARGEVLVVSDANVRVPRSYLRSLVGALLRPGVGLDASPGRGARFVLEMPIDDESATAQDAAPPSNAA